MSHRDITASTQPVSVLLNDGASLPAIGLGTFGMTGPQGVDAIVSGLQAGYRLLDTAVGYGNEAEVGTALRRSGVATSEVVVTTKIRGRDLGYEAARRNIAESRRILGIEQIGLHLIHWPMPQLDRYVDTWRALIAARRDGDIRSIGVSNFTAEHLNRIIDATGEVPAVNQVELHPHLPQEELRRVHDGLGIRTQSWSPLGRGPDLLHAPEVLDPARRRSVGPGQIVLRWHHQLGSVPIPRSRNPQRQRDNLAIQTFQLSDAEMAIISALGRNGGTLWGADPDVTGFM